MRTPHGSSEPIIADWQPVTAGELLARLPRRRADGPRIIAVDGRSAGGKSTLAGRLAGVAADAAVVHTDDVAWNYSMFDWAEALVDHILQPVRAGQSVHYRPPGWVSQDRSGAIDVPTGIDTLIVEGVGAGRREVTGLVDAVIWVQSDAVVARELGIARDVALGHLGDLAACTAFWEHWTEAELPFLEDQQPWLRAGMIVAGTGVADRLDHHAGHDRTLWVTAAP